VYFLVIYIKASNADDFIASIELNSTERLLVINIIAAALVLVNGRGF
jgi:hypothetical protein